MRAPHLKLVTDNRTVKQAYLENGLRLLLEVAGLEVKDRYDAGISATALMMPRSKSTRLRLFDHDDEEHCEMYDCQCLRYKVEEFN